MKEIQCILLLINLPNHKPQIVQRKDAILLPQNLIVFQGSRVTGDKGII